MSEEWKDVFYAEAMEKNFLNVERFRDFFLEKSLKKGKPFWLAKKEMTSHGVSTLEGDEERYDDRKAIVYLLKRKKSFKEKSDLKKYLLNKGFSYDLSTEVVENYFLE